MVLPGVWLPAASLVTRYTPASHREGPGGSGPDSPPRKHMAYFALRSARWQAGVATLTSAGAHVFAFVVAAILVRQEVGPSDGPLLPPLYLYAPDRRPGVRREIRLPIPAPPGVPRGTTDAPPRSVFADAPSSSPVLRPRGLPAPGRYNARIDSVYSSIQVDSQVARYEWTVAPAYPDSLRVAGTEGFVVAEFVVDTTGQVDLETVQIVRSTHPAFRESVRAALAGMQFRPAWRGLHKVRQLVRQRFAFRLMRPPGDTASL